MIFSAVKHSVRVGKHHTVRTKPIRVMSVEAAEISFTLPLTREGHSPNSAHRALKVLNGLLVNPHPLV